MLHQMPTDVTLALQQIAQKEGGMGTAAAVEFVAKLERSRRLQLETWS